MHCAINIVKNTHHIPFLIFRHKRTKYRQGGAYFKTPAQKISPLIQNTLSGAKMTCANSPRGDVFQPARILYVVSGARLQRKVTASKGKARQGVRLFRFRSINHDVPQNPVFDCANTSNLFPYWRICDFESDSRPAANHKMEKNPRAGCRKSPRQRRKQRATAPWRGFRCRANGRAKGERSRAD